MSDKQTEPVQVIQLDVESLSAKFHEIYMAEAKRQGDVRHKDAYADLPENIKEFDRVLARYVLNLLTTPPPASPVAPAPRPGMTVEGWGLPHEKNWDGYGASPISAEVECNARKLWNVLHSNPEPTSNETLSFETESGTIEIGKTRIFGYFGDDTNRVFLDGTLRVAPVATGETAQRARKFIEAWFSTDNASEAYLEHVITELDKLLAAQPNDLTPLAGTPERPDYPTPAETESLRVAYQGGTPEQLLAKRLKAYDNELLVATRVEQDLIEASRAAIAGTQEPPREREAGTLPMKCSCAPIHSQSCDFRDSRSSQ